MDLNADGSGFIPSDLDAERELVRGLIADRHCNVTLPVEQLFDPHHQKCYSLIQAIQADGRHREQPASRAA